MDIVEQLRKSANTIYEQDGYTFRLGLQNEAADEIERLRRANKVQACTIRSLQYSKSKIVYEAHIAVKTLDGEKEANAILTDEIERLQNVNKAQVKWLYDEQQAHKALRDKVRQWLRDDKPDILKEGE